MAEKIGIKAIFEDSQFVQGLRRYISGIGMAEDATDKAAKSTSAAWQGMGSVVAASSAFIAKQLYSLTQQMIQSVGDIAQLGAQSLRTKESFDTLAASIGETGETLLANDAYADERFFQLGEWAAPSSLSVPIKVADKVIGVLEVEGDRPGAFTEEEDAAALEIAAD